MFDNEATLSFINSSLVKQRGLPIDAHVGFEVKVVRGTLPSWNPLVPQLSITNHTVAKNFFIVDRDVMKVTSGIN